MKNVNISIPNVLRDFKEWDEYYSIDFDYIGLLWPYSLELCVSVLDSFISKCEKQILEKYIPFINIPQGCSDSINNAVKELTKNDPYIVDEYSSPPLIWLITKDLYVKQFFWWGEFYIREITSPVITDPDLHISLRCYRSKWVREWWRNEFSYGVTIDYVN